MFVPLSHPPGHAQADFGEADAIIAGVKYRAHFFVMTLPHSDACFVAAYPAATTEAWLDGHNRAFVFFGGVPQSILYDNDKCLVSRILSDGTRQRTRAFSGLQSHYLFEDRYGRPGKVIGCGAGIIARHPRSYDREDMVFDPIHYLALLEHKIGALDQAAPLAGWELPDAFPTLRRLLEARMGKAGKREYVQVLRLLETFDLEVLHGAVKDALRLGAIGYDAVKHLVLCRIERRPPKLDLDIYPYLPRANVATTAAASYMSLLGGGAS